MSFEGVKVTKLDGGLGRTTPSEDGVAALVVALSDLPSEIEYYKPYQLLQPRDVELLGFDEAFDANKEVLVKNQTDLFFQYSPEGILYLILVPDAIESTAQKPQDICSIADFKAAIRTAIQVKFLGFLGFNTPASEIAATATAVQINLVDELASEKRLIDAVILECEPEADIAGVQSLPDLSALAAGNISVCIAQDPAIAEIDEAYESYSDIGSVLGMISVRQVNENLGSVNILQKPAAKRGMNDYPLTQNGSWSDANISNGLNVSALSGIDKKQLTSKGYIFAGNYDGYGGVFFNDSPTATDTASDYSQIENNRIWNKAARRIRSVLMPEIKGVVKKDPQTGYIRDTTISRWTGLVNASLEKMQSAEEISGFDCYINPKQILSSKQALKVKARVVSDDIVHEMDVELGLTDKL